MADSDQDNFENLIDLVEPNTILDEFDKIICFLYSDSSVLLFANILKNAELLLVNIIKDTNNLKNEKLKIVSEGISALIHNVLDMNKHIFEILYEYEYGKLNKKILIYKKSYFSRSKTGLVQLTSNSSHPTTVRQQELHDKYLTDRYILLQKIPKEMRKRVLKTEDFQKYLLERSTPADDLKRQTELLKQYQSNLKNQKYNFVELSLVSKKAMLQTILDFLTDILRATLVFEDKSLLETTFLICATSKAKSKKMFIFLPSDCQSLLTKITSALSGSTHYKLHIVQGRMDKTTKLSNVTFTKLPHMDSKKDKSHPETAEHHGKHESSSADTKRDSSISSDRKGQPAVQLRSGRHRPRASPVNRRVQDPMNPRTMKLLADMATPLKSDKAMKMMKNMGWEGGALGARGEGITEPIMPALGMVQGAGLGHIITPDLKIVKAPVKPTSKVEVRNSIVNTILEFVRSKSSEMVVDWDEVLTSKQVLFWNGVIQKVNDRTPSYPGASQESMALIVREMLTEPTMQLDLVYSGDKRQIKLVKAEKCQKPESTVKVFRNSPSFEVNMHRILKSILELYKSDETEAVHQLSVKPSKKHLKVVQDVVTCLNKAIDNEVIAATRDICEQIKPYSNEYILVLTFNGALTYTLKKISKYRKKYTNSALTAIINEHGNTNNNLKQNSVDVEMTSSRNHLLSDNDEECDKPINVGVYEKKTNGMDDFKTVITQSEYCDNKIYNCNNPKGLVSKMDTDNVSRMGQSVGNNPKPSVDFKTISIAQNYPADHIEREKISEIQKSISDAIEKAEYLPLLNCHGVQYGALVYGCHDVKSFDFLKEILDDFKDITIVDENVELEVGDYKIAIRINSYSENVDNLFVRLEQYNSGLSTTGWSVLKKVLFCDCVVVTAVIDERSYNYICESRFSLYAGIDKVQCSLVWD